ncbi:uncharacterized protein LOC135842275 [Planococcus citri]|uniref:uncharacterized protein LOC135842275 n=1 Tax=Planococcus citri TaxID=170843 RepID=UPI0031F96BD0
MKFLFHVLFISLISMYCCSAKCKFGEINYKEENDEEVVLKHYLSHKLSFSNVWNNILRGRFIDPVTNLLTSDKQSLCECVYEKAYGGEAEPHTLDEQKAQLSQRKLRQIFKKDGTATQKLELVVKCEVDKKTFFLSQGYQSYEDRNVHDVYAYELNDKNQMQFKGMVEKLNFSDIDKHPLYNKFVYHFMNANLADKHES